MCHTDLSENTRRMKEKEMKKQKCEKLPTKAIGPQQRQVFIGRSTRRSKRPVGRLSEALQQMEIVHVIRTNQLNDLVDAEPKFDVDRFTDVGDWNGERIVHRLLPDKFVS